MSLDERFKESLIEEVRKYPELWDPRIKDPTKKGMDWDLWKKVAQTLGRYFPGKNEKDCYETFRNLKDYYRKINKRFQSDSDSVFADQQQQIYFKPIRWKFFNSLQFLNCLIEEQEESPPCLSATIRLLKQGLGEKEELNEEELFDYSANNKRVKLTGEVKCEEDEESPVIKSSFSSLSSSSSHFQHSTTMEQDDYLDSFGKTVVGQLRKLHPDLHTETMYEIQKVLMEQEKKSRQIVKL